MRFDLEHLARTIGATYMGPSGDHAFAVGASQDSRTITPGMIFVPLRAERDGHEFIDAALERGARAYFSEYVPRDGRDVIALVVDDTGRALFELGVYARARLDAHVVAVTGSVGKTSTKDLCAATFGSHWRTHASERSFNNEIGVPLTLANAPDDAGAVIVEMGARGIGHINTLCAIASPTIAVVTVVAGAHLEMFGDIDGVAQAKGEVVEALPAHGLAVLNADDSRVLRMRERTTARVLTYGNAGDVRPTDIALDAELRPTFTVHTPWGSAPVRLGARGAHNVANACAAIAAACGAGAPLDAVAASLAQPLLSPWRMELGRAPDGPWVLNDAYNANPTSMRAALDALVALDARRHFAVLGEMAELGDDGAAAHALVGAYALERGVTVIAVGTDAYGPIGVADIDAALSELAHQGCADTDAVLVKASRVAGLERLAHQLLNG